MTTRSSLAAIMFALMVASASAAPFAGKGTVPIRMDAGEQSAPSFPLLGTGGDTTCIYYEDFQDGEGGWAPVDVLAPDSAIYWHRATYDYGDGHGERSVMWCGDSIGFWGSPPGYGNHWIQYLTKEFDLTLPSPQAAYEFQYDTEQYYDSLYLDVSDDGGQTFIPTGLWPTPPTYRPTAAGRWCCGSDSSPMGATATRTGSTTRTEPYA
jgi:hypothetical protein